ncbi:MAG: histone deacetylase family protein [Roseiflexaceae bacterium]|nr:histone deacetylase family protein [Roseiflexaceae bacterium]
MQTTINNRSHARMLWYHTALMITITTPDHALHAAPHEFLDGQIVPAFESPARAEIIHAALRAAAFGPILPPRQFGEKPLLAVHDASYLRFLETIYQRWVAAGATPAAVIPSTFAARWMNRPCNDPLAEPGYYLFDGSAPIMADTYRIASQAANAALTAADLLLQGERAAYALCRPPGHHAGSDLGGGYCYLNNAAIAAQYLRQHSERVAVLDIDFHHGNGTQQIFYERGDVLVVSIHADPARNYPYFSGYADESGQGSGTNANLNIPLTGTPTNDDYMIALEQAGARIASFAPGFLVVSAGLDTYSGDPVAENGAGFALTQAAYPLIGARIADLGLPTLFAQEGGYGVAALGENVVALLRGFIVQQEQQRS